VDSRPDYKVLAATIEYPDVDMPAPETLREISAPVLATDRPRPESWPLTLSDAAEITLANSEVIWDIGGRVVGAPGSVATV
jgi:hypothetical protein